MIYKPDCKGHSLSSCDCDSLLLNSSPQLFPTPATRLPVFLGVRSLRSVHLIIQHHVSLLVLLCRLFKTAAIIIALVQIALLFIISIKLGPQGFQYLAHLYNLWVNHCNIFAIRKHAMIIPVPKPGKLLDQVTSYRLISLLCPCWWGIGTPFATGT